MGLGMFFMSNEFGIMTEFGLDRFMVDLKLVFLAAKSQHSPLKNQFTSFNTATTSIRKFKN